MGIVRVISGNLKGKKLEGYNVPMTRPTMDRVKESMFASIQNNISESIVLDLFCGSGSLGIEALSNGAKHCYFVDNGPEILKYLRQNINNLKISDNASIINKDYHTALCYFKENKIKFNLVLVDAPYKMKAMEEVLNILTTYNLLEENSLIVLEYSFDKLKENYPHLEQIKNKKYGDKYVSIYRFNK